MIVPEIKIKGETFRLDFSLMALLILGEKWGLETLDEVIAKIAELDNGSSGMSLKSLRMFDEIIHSLANSSGVNARELKEHEILKLPIEETMALFASFSEMMIAAVQSKNSLIEETSGKLKAVKAAKK